MKDIMELRKDIKLSQEELAFRSGVSKYKIGLYERGHGDLTDEEFRSLHITMRKIIESRFRSIGPTHFLVKKTV